MWLALLKAVLCSFSTKTWKGQTEPVCQLCYLMLIEAGFNVHNYDSFWQKMNKWIFTALCWGPLTLWLVFDLWLMNHFMVCLNSSKKYCDFGSCFTERTNVSHRPGGNNNLSFFYGFFSCFFNIKWRSHWIHLYPSYESLSLTCLIQLWEPVKPLGDE